jgi:hypothetical protein
LVTDHTGVGRPVYDIFPQLVNLARDVACIVVGTAMLANGRHWTRTGNRSFYRAAAQHVSFCYKSFHGSKRSTEPRYEKWGICVCERRLLCQKWTLLAATCSYFLTCRQFPLLL